MPSEPVTLADLASLLDPSQRARIIGDPAAAVSELHHDSRRVTPGSLFAAIRGATADGHDHAPVAVAGGATALLVEQPLNLGVPQIVVHDSRAAMGYLAARIHGRPAEQMRTVGITGTNGKTTVTHMLGAIARAAGVTAGVVGTVGIWIGDEEVPAVRTTPEAGDLQRLLAAMVERGVETVALEVSSHALTLGRVNGIRFDVAGFTNLSQDHLDFHPSLEDYFEAKASLFTPARTARAVVCIDDEWGERLVARSSVPTVTVGIANPAAEVVAVAVESDLSGSRFVLDVAGEQHPIEVPLAGSFNVENALVAAACALEADLSIEAVVEGLAGLRQVPGRFELVETGRPFAVVVDYAHSPDAIAAVIRHVRGLTAERIITVVGAGGDRDRDKRPLMGSAASQSDVAVFTSDNPRSEDPASILDAVVSGADGPAEIITELDRRVAIRRAVRMACPGDAVLVLGKGHELGQEIGDAVLPFDDREVVRGELAALDSVDASDESRTSEADRVRR